MNMGMFGNLMGKVFGTSHPAVTAPAPTPAEVTAAPAAVEAATGAPPVDYEAVLDAINDKNPEELDWRVSIVDLMKLVGMDSSLSARKELAHELHYTGDTGDSASMNIWLHQQVMAIFSKNGGKMTA
jgi:Domain of unknown function (DUF3597)